MHHRIKIRACVRIAALLLWTFGVAVADTPATITGRVTDQALGEPVEGVNIRVEGTLLGTVTDREGRFELTNLSPGRYVLTLSRIGFAAWTSEAIDLQSGAEQNLDVTLVSQAFSLDQVVVTATRTENRLKDSPVLTELITRHDIESTGAEDIGEILEEHVGTQLEKSEGHGFGVEMQGLDSKYILILVDGEEVIGRTAGNIDLRQVPIESVERIEVVKGASSVLYGSEAMGGVINIITKTAQGPTAFSFTSTFGSNQKIDPRATLSWKQDRISVLFSASHNHSDGFDLDASDIAHDTTWDARVSKEIGTYFKVYGGIDNIFDRVEREFERFGSDPLSRTMYPGDRRLGRS